MITISTGSAFILTLIILPPYLSISTMDLAIFSSTRTATPFWSFSPPVWIILTPSLVKSPSSFHLVSASPITSKFALFSSLMTLLSFPGLSMVRTFHVPTWILFFRSFFFFWFLFIWQGDQGTNFKSSLTKEFLKMFGVTPRLNTPGHPESSGIVEKWNQTFKKMIHQVVIDNPRQWHKIILFTVWAIREIPNATTGVAPYMLVYGLLPRGPLAVLKESWTGDINLPSRFGLQPKKYLQKMKENLEKAVVYANEHSTEKQLQYTNQYNKKDKHKAYSGWMTR